MASTMYYGGDLYCKLSAGGVNCLENSAGTILKCIDDILNNYTRDDTDAFSIADFGTADGSICLHLINQIITKVQIKRGREKEILVTLEDQATNDFNALFSVIYGLRQSQIKSKKLQIDENVFVFVSGTSMYKQCLPSKSIDLALSSVALQCLSELPCNIKDGVYYVDADKEEYNQFKKKAEEDWKAFVVSRGKELKPGGKIAAIVLAKNAEGNINRQVIGGYHTLTTIAKQMVSEHVITHEENVSMTWNAYHRTEEDFRKIFDQKDNDIVELGLELDSISYKEVIYKPGLDPKDKTDDVKRRSYAQGIVELHRPWLNNTIYKGLSENRSEEERCQIVNCYFKRLQEIAFNGDTHPPGVYIYAEVIITKKK